MLNIVHIPQKSMPDCATKYILLSDKYLRVLFTFTQYIPNRTTNTYFVTCALYQFLQSRVAHQYVLSYQPQYQVQDIPQVNVSRQSS